MIAIMHLLTECLGFSRYACSNCTLRCVEISTRDIDKQPSKIQQIAEKLL